MKNNYCVIMSGGIGSRFWPFSRTHRPKQFIDFFGTGRSLLQQTYDRFINIIPEENIFIVTNELYADLVREQLPKLKPDQILLEPQRRNTAPCIAWAAYHINAINPEANIVVAPSDHLILKEAEFVNNITHGLDFVKNNPILLTLGITPTKPETGYGYIQLSEDKVGKFNKVKTFTEKPDLELAKVFVNSGEFLWNSGMFLWNVKTIISAFQQYQPEIANRFDAAANVFNSPLEPEFINLNFPACPNISIDFGIMEKASNVYVYCADFEWSDLGTWGALYDLSEKDENSNVNLNCKMLNYESENNMIVLPENKLAVVHGLNNYIIVESDNVLLICKKEDEQRIKQYVTDAKMKFGEEFV